jgi:hypothetical protein
MKDKFIIFGAFTGWLIPFLVSIFMYSPETKTFLPSLLIFKVVMSIVLISVTFVSYKLLKNNALLSFRVPTYFLIINLLLDISILVLLFQTPFFAWLATTLPVYFIVFYGLYFMMRK